MEKENKHEKKPNQNVARLRKNSLHYKFYKWLYNIDPVKEYKGYCPYFWRYVITILLLPILIIGKFLMLNIGWLTNHIFDTVSDLNFKRKQKKYDIKKAKYDELENKKSEALGLAYTTYINNQTNENAIIVHEVLKKYNISYYEVLYIIKKYNMEYKDSDIRDDINNIYHIYQDYKYEQEKKSQEKIDKITENIYFRIFGGLGLMCIVIPVCYGLYFVISKNFDIICEVGKYMLLFIVVCVFILGIVVLLEKSYDFIAKIIWFVISGIFNIIVRILFLKKVVSGLVIFGKILHTIYKDNCPRLIWIDDEELQ